MHRSIRLLPLTLALLLAACPEPLDEAPTLPLDVAYEPVLTDLAREAIALVPGWLRDDLQIALQGLDEDLQNEYALTIVDEDDPYLHDEIGFVIAHLSPESLTSTNFYPELLTLNAELIYERDADLEYVELVEYGEPGDEDHYTTTRYRVGRADSEDPDAEPAVVEQEIDRDTYYWYVVHPRHEDEKPGYFDPDLAGSPYRAPDQGVYWRDFLWWAPGDDCHDDVGTCPVLSEQLDGVDLLWQSRYGTGGDANGAMGRIIDWVNGVMHFGALPEPSIQPVRIWGLHHGNCGEHGDITNAAVRIGLIPGIVITARGNDHCWSEFRDDDWTASGWVQVEPVNTSIDYYGYYADGDGNYRRTLNGFDDDCDGFADEVASTADADEDGVTIADGDCHDGRPDVFPGAPEVANRYDDDCDGVADNGLEIADADLDLDEDGWTLAAGDCDDTVAGTNPDANDPQPSTNRLMGLTGGRGDAFVLNRTADYVNTFELVVNVTDEAGLPVDGALVWIAGWSTTYAEATGWWPVTEMVADATGTARMHLGYANEYAIRVDSAAGSNPTSENSIVPIIDYWIEAGETFEIDVTVYGDGVSTGPRVESVVDLGGATPDYALTVTHEVTDHLVTQKSRMLHDTFTYRWGAPAGIDVFVVDQWGYERFVDGRGFAALGHTADSVGATTTVDISDDREWYVVAVNDRLGATTVVGDLSVAVEALGDVPLAAPLTLDRHLLLGPGEHTAFHVGRPVEAAE